MWLVAAVAGFLIYWGLFYRAPLPELTFATADGATYHPQRYELFAYFLQPSALFGPWFGEPASFAIGDRVPLLTLAALILLFAGFVGRLALQLSRIDDALDALEKVVFALAVGLSLVSLYTLAVGLSGAIAARGALLLFVLPAALAVVLSQRLWARRSASRRAILPSSDEMALSPHWLWLAAPFAIVIVLGGMLPPVDFDVREYHLQAPKEFFLKGRIALLPHNAYGNMALGSEMLTLLAMIVRDDWWSGALVGKTIGALFAPLTALALFAAGRRFISTSAGVIAAIVYLSTPWVAKVATSGLVEAAAAFYWFMAVYAVLLIEQGSGGDPSPAKDRGGPAREAASNLNSSHLRRVGLAGFLAGSAVAVKYPAALFVLVPIGIWILARRQTLLGSHGGLRTRLRDGLVFALLALAACGPWFAKNWYFTGNPTYPLLAEFFDGATRTPELVARWEAAHRPPNFNLDDLGARLVDVLGRSPWHSSIVIPLACLALFHTRRNLSRWLFLYVAFVVAAWWLATHRIDRFWVPVLPVLASLAGIGGTLWVGVRWRRLIGAVLVVGSIANFLFVPGGPDGYTRYFVPLDQLRVAPERVDAWHLWLNKNTPEGKAVLSVGDAQVFDLEVPVYYNTTFDPSIFTAWVRDRSPAEIRAALREHEIAFVYVHWGEIERYRSAGNYGFDPFITRAVFAQLVEQDVLARPWPQIPGHPAQVFPVQLLEPVAGR